MWNTFRALITHSRLLRIFHRKHGIDKDLNCVTFLFTVYIFVLLKKKTKVWALLIGEGLMVNYSC